MVVTSEAWRMKDISSSGGGRRKITGYNVDEVALCLLFTLAQRQRMSEIRTGRRT